MHTPGRLGRRLLVFALGLTAAAVQPVPLAAHAVPLTAGAALPAASPEPTAYLVADADSGTVVAAKNSHLALLPASTVKLLTALAALERLPLDATVPVSARAAAQPSMKINMHEGEIWKLDDALHALLIVSANDAAYAIAERSSGSIEKFATDANATARRLGLHDTTFRDPAGLDDGNSFGGGSRMSTYDLAATARNALAVPEIANIAKLLTYEFTDPAGAGRRLRNHNKGFLTAYPGATGLKTGFTKAANRTLVASATRNARTCIAVVMGTWDDTGWAGRLLDQCFGTTPGAVGTGEHLPPVRATTLDLRRRAFEGLPGALGRPGLAAAATATAPVARAAAPRAATKPAGSAAATPVAPVAATRAVGSERGRSAGGIFTWRTLGLVLLALGLTVFLLRRRAVRRQRARRIARQRAMAEARRRRMIDIVEPHEREGASQVRVTSERRRVGARR